MSEITDHKKARKLLAIQQVEEEEKKKEEIVKKQLSARTLPVLIRGTKETAIINYNEYNSDIHICI